MTILQLLSTALAICGLAFAGRLVMASKAARGNGDADRPVPTPRHLAIGFATNFFDTLGIGSFATTTTIFRILREPADELIPGTIIAGHALPVLAQALLFINAVSVDPLQLGLLIAACAIGGWLGAGIVSTLSRRKVQLGMGAALLVAASFMLVGLSNLFPTGGTAVVFAPRAFVLALAINFTLGALLTLGIGNYAPSLVAFSLLGIDPRAAFPIMMGSGAFVALVAGARFVERGRFHLRSALGLTLGGVPGVAAAVWLVTSLPLGALRWIVLLVVVYAGVTLLRAGLSRTPGRAESIDDAAHEPLASDRRSSAV
jgi:uncharacterized membrane protein YfcA